MPGTIKKRSRFEGLKRSLAQIPLGHHAIYKGAKSHALDLIYPQAAFLPIFEPRFAPCGLTVNKPQRWPSGGFLGLLRSQAFGLEHLGFDAVAFEGGEVIDEQPALEVVHFMLNAHGQQAIGLDFA